MSANIVDFPGITTLDCDPDRLLQRAIGNVESVVIIGYAKDGGEYFASSIADGAATAWLLQRSIHKLMTITDEVPDEH